MNIQTHLVDTIEIAEVIADGVIVRHADDALDLMANLYYQGFDRMTRYRRYPSEAFNGSFRIGVYF